MMGAFDWALPLLVTLQGAIYPRLNFVEDG